MLAIYVASLLFAGLRFLETRPNEFSAFVIGVSSLFVAICAWKGERPRWRWGGLDDEA